MIESILNIVFQVFTFEPVLVCCGFCLVVGVFGLIRRFLWSDYTFKEK